MKRIIWMVCFVLLTLSCSNNSQNSEPNKELEQLRTELKHLKTSIAKENTNTKNQISTFLTFQENNAEEAMNFYVGLFENSKIIDIQRYGKEGPGKEGTLFYAKFVLNGSNYMCSNSYIKHEWDFTPAVSNFVECKSEKELTSLFSKLSENGNILMPIDNYGFSQKFGFIEDRFGVSWQLNLQ